MKEEADRTLSWPKRAKALIRSELSDLAAGPWSGTRSAREIVETEVEFVKGNEHSRTRLACCIEVWDHKEEDKVDEPQHTASTNE